ncbi:MAG: hypothetical protein FWE32_03815 [Oscillospiraceae bacterium]|nr:hypothetical protein [Oscillospiraceae bacterium]
MMRTVLRWVAVVVVGGASVFLAQRLILKLYKNMQEKRKLAAIQDDAWMF